MLVADAGFAGLAVHLGGRLDALDAPRPGGRARPRGRGAGRAAAVGLPVLARRTVEAGAQRPRVGGRGPGLGGGGRAHERRRPRVGHGGHAGAVPLGRPAARARAATTGPRPLGLGYRRSSLGPCRRRGLGRARGLGPGDPAAGRAAIAEIVRWRREHQPGGSNAGSVFTNPPGDSAGRLIEAAGLKGFRLGIGPGREKHANFIQADPGGSADDVRRLMDHVRRVVAERSGWSCRPEVRLVGFAGVDNGARDLLGGSGVNGGGG